MHLFWRHVRRLARRQYEISEANPLPLVILLWSKIGSLRHRVSDEVILDLLLELLQNLSVIAWGISKSKSTDMRSSPWMMRRAEPPYIIHLLYSRMVINKIKSIVLRIFRLKTLNRVVGSIFPPVAISSNFSFCKSTTLRQENTRV